MELFIPDRRLKVQTNHSLALHLYEQHKSKKQVPVLYTCENWYCMTAVYHSHSFQTNRRIRIVLFKIEYHYQSNVVMEVLSNT